jgi:hypothetical protein
MISREIPLRVESIRAAEARNEDLSLTRMLYAALRVVFAEPAQHAHC